MESILSIMETCFSVFVITTIVDIIVMGSFSLRILKSNKISQFVVQKENRIDIQKGNECSGYATAYLLRHYDIPANGTEIYQKMPYKASDGCVPPKGIKKVLESYGFHVKYCAGNLNALKAEVCKGNPVIVFIKVKRGKKWLHFYQLSDMMRTIFFWQIQRRDLPTAARRHITGGSATKIFWHCGIRQC